MFEFLFQPWPWYIGGPLIGLMVFVMLYFTGGPVRVSSSLEHVCAAVAPGKIPLFNYDWKKKGLSNLMFVCGIVIGGFLGGVVFLNPEPIALSENTRNALQALGLTDFKGLVPAEIFNWSSLATPKGFAVMVAGGFLVGFGARYARGCTSGHSISGISDLQVASAVATVGFFAGGLVMTHLLYPILFGLF